MITIADDTCTCRSAIALVLHCHSGPDLIQSQRRNRRRFCKYEQRRLRIDDNIEISKNNENSELERCNCKQMRATHSNDIGWNIIITFPFSCCYW
jgi:hypothetical protein